MTQSMPEAGFSTREQGGCRIHGLRGFSKINLHHPMTAVIRFFVVTTILLSAFAFAANDVSFADGKPGWRISDGKCTFLVPGRIVNNSPPGSLSGTLRLALWATSGPFPGTGYRVATYTLGQLKGGYQYSNLNPVTKASIPNISGDFYFTVVLEQYDSSGWIWNDASEGSVKRLKNGVFVTPKKWKAPAGEVIPPRKKLNPGDLLRITLQASKSNGGIIYVPDGTQLKLKIKIQANGKTTVYGGSHPEGAKALYTYAKSTDSYAGKSHPVGSLSLDYGVFYGVDSTSDLSLFFQKSNKGYYKSIDTEQGYSGTSWGIFTFE